MQEQLGKLEIDFIHRFCDQFAPETAGQDVITRLDKVECRFKNLLLGVETLHHKYRQEFVRENKP